MKPINFEAMAVAHYMTDDATTFDDISRLDIPVANAVYANRDDVLLEAKCLARAFFQTYMLDRDEEEHFNKTYPPDLSLPTSVEFDEEDGYYGYYGSSEEDTAVVLSANPRCVWSFADGPKGFTAYSGILKFSFTTNYFISSVPRAGEHSEQYLLRPDEEGPQ